MAQDNSLTVYNASAGSGKTYTLVKQYLSILLQSSNPFKYRNLLAITFTNKAVEEMKARVIETLQEFSQVQGGDPTPAMMQDIATETHLATSKIVGNSKTILENIIHDYASLDILTIDTLTHRILRTFSKDLGLSGNFEVSMDVNEVYEKAVAALIDQAGTDEEITKVLINFALEKIDDNRSWDISYDLNTMAKLLQKENDRAAVFSLAQHDLSDFKILRARLDEIIGSLKAKIASATEAIFEKLTAHEITTDHFLNTFGNHLKKIRVDQDAVKFSTTAKWINDLEQRSFNFYRGNEKPEIKAAIDGIKEALFDFFIETKELHYKKSQLLDFRKRLVPLSVLQLIHREILKIKDEENILLISDFNDKIYKHLRNQPAAFIYERLGERYTNYFVDEFQDTSVMQWSNLVPLMENALSTVSQDEIPHTALLVGDPKQAIYRWRGGKAEQFINLSNGKQPFAIENTNTKQLDTNWRSHEEIIRFNNGFFTFLSSEFGFPEYASIYKTDNDQKTNFRTNGLVTIDFVEGKTVEDLEPLYLEKVLEIITQIQEDTIPLDEVCILTRNNSHGAKVAQFLAENDIRVVSNESLLLDTSEKVQCLHALLSLLAQPDTTAFTLVILKYLAAHLALEDTHKFIYNHVHLPTDTLFDRLRTEYAIHIDSGFFHEQPLYEATEYLVRALGMDQKGDAFLVGYLNELFAYTSSRGGLIDFLDHYDQKKEKLSIQVPAQDNAVQLMTIHKSKGLEFPIVIFPYADADLYSHREEYHWVSTPPEEFVGFKQLLLSHRSEMKQYGEETAALFEERQSQQQFDAINVLYVALTRAVERLYVVSRFRESKNKNLYYGHLLQAYLKHQGLWETAEKRYQWGAPPKRTGGEKKPAAPWNIPFRSSPKETHNIQVITKASQLWDDQRQEAVAYGNLVHELLSRIDYRGVQEGVVMEGVQEGLLAPSEATAVLKRLNSIMEHPDLASLYSAGNTVYNEKVILAADGSMHIPDRIEIEPNGKLTIVDYKTGTPQENHEFQLDRYRSILEEMDLKTDLRKLVYINEEITVLTV